MNTMSYEKARQYAKYRLLFSAEAARFVISEAGVCGGTVADIGAGTGLLTLHFIGQIFEKAKGNQARSAAAIFLWRC